jgi:hypothetical protein
MPAIAGSRRDDASRLNSQAVAGHFIDRLVEWKDFERFVAGMYAEDKDLVVEHNVTVTGKSGATRQIDVRFTYTVKSHTYVTVVECKRGKRRSPATGSMFSRQRLRT